MPPKKSGCRPDLKLLNCLDFVRKTLSIEHQSHIPIAVQKQKANTQEVTVQKVRSSASQMIISDQNIQPDTTNRRHGRHSQMPLYRVTTFAL
jgi:hypothetical protein